MTLNEQPHVELMDDLEWDFTAEKTDLREIMKNGGWLKQLINIYKNNVIFSLDHTKNDYSYLKINEIDLNEITDNLCSDLFFILSVKRDIKNTNKYVINDLKTFLPLKLQVALDI